MRVPCRTLDSVIQTLGITHISLLKIDVEGFEPHVLRGARQLLAEHRPVVIYEYNEYDTPAGRGGSMIEAMNSIIRQSGPYRFHGFLEDGTLVPDVSNFQGHHVDVIGVPS